MLTPAGPSSEHQALTDFHELLRAACEGHPPSRPQSVLYQSCRATLTGGRIKAFLPGFVRQCASIERFREFIQLYDRDPAVRIEFVDGALAESWANLGRPPLERPAAPASAPAASPLTAPPLVAAQVAMPAPPVADDADGFMDDPDDPDDPEEDRGPAARDGPAATPAADFLSEVAPSRLRGAH